MVEGGEEGGLRSLSSTYSFSSESECSLEPKEEAKGTGASQEGGRRGGLGAREEGGRKGVTGAREEAGRVGSGRLRNPQLSNVTARRRADSSSEREVERREGVGAITTATHHHPSTDPPHQGLELHPGHVVIGGSSSDEEEGQGLERVEVPLVEREERELGSLSTPRLLEQVLGPLACPAVSVSLVGPWGEGLVGTATTLVQATLPEREWRHERLRLLRLQPVYWREWRVRRGAATSPTPHSPLHSAWHSHLMSLSLVMASVHEGYLYHLPGHLRRPGKGVGVARIATYPFTSPALDLVLEPSVLHALTETGLETYTLRAGYHTVREAEQVDGRTNALPPPSTPICLIGLRPFLGVRSLHVADHHLVLVSEPEVAGEEWTVYSLQLPHHSVLFKDMLQVADMNAGAPHGFLQLVSEAHVVARTWLHRLAWLQAIKPGGQEVTAEEVEEARANYRLSCLKLADHYVGCPGRARHSLAIPYYLMSQLPPIEVLERLPLDNPLAPGVIGYIESLLLQKPTKQEETFLEAKVVNKIISILGQHSVPDLVRLILSSSALRGIKTQQSLELLQKDLGQVEVGGEHGVAVVLVGGPGSWLALVPPVTLASTLLSHHHLLFEVEPQGRGPQSFSSLGLEVRLHAPLVFAEVSPPPPSHSSPA